MSAIWVEITGAKGSTPRDVGTAMQVTAKASQGTIGGGALEYQAIDTARKILFNNGQEMARTYPLGPDLGQCCGGAVTLKYTREERPLDPPLRPVLEVTSGHEDLGDLWLWGAGHVGRAVVNALPAKAFSISWVDSGADRFPGEIPNHVTAVPAADMVVLAKRAPRSAHHLIFTYSHDIDLALCAALLDHGAGSIGLIGSETKRARFFKRLREAGLDPSPIQCPIGDKSLGKAPVAIASGVAAQLLSRSN